ncbi:radical SAM protein [Archaeoglobales archaeon]|nr:MAG: radical SAM protein [Archaeoglobales archaeon]
MKEIKRFIKNLDYPAHCIGCEGIDDSIKNPKHHPSYEITPKCNLNCIFCYSKVAELKGTLPKPGYYGDLEPKAITISQFGEPFVAGNRKVCDIINKLRDLFGDVRIDIQTNGTLVNFDMIEGKADIFMISLDAGNKKGYYEITGSNLFDKVINTIKRASNSDCVSVVRTVFMPGINDTELKTIAEIASECDEFFLQPISIYKENTKLIKKLDIERAESIGEYIRTAYSLSEIANVKIPGCFLLNLKAVMKRFDFEDVMLLRRNAFGSMPKVIREWRFEL